MAFNFARLKSWLGYENLTNADLNAEYNNLIAKAGADTLSGANSTSGSSPTVAAMQASEAPGGVGSEVLSTTVQEDIKQLRSALASITGQTYWYQTPAINLANVNTNINGIVTVPQSRIISGRSDANGQPMFLVPDGTVATIRLKAASTNFNAYFNGTNQVFNADLSITTLSTAPAATNTCLVNDATLAGAQITKTQGERGTFININTIGASITALNGTYAAFKTSTEYFIAEVDTTNNRLKNCIRGVGFDSTDAWKARVVISNGNTITLMKLTWVFATYNASTAGIAITYNRPTVSYLSPSGPAIGDYWYDISNNTWKTYNGSVWTATIATFAGICIQDTTACQVARSADFYHVFNQLNTVDIEYVGTGSVRSTRLGQQTSVYGTTFSYYTNHITWDTSTTLDSGEALTASTTYYCYLTNLGDIKTSTVRPSERKYDLLGSYHPSKPWRCVAEFSTDGSSNVVNNTFIIENDFVTPNTATIVKSANFTFTTASTTLVDVTNATLSIQTFGKPVFLFVQSDTSASAAEITIRSTASIATATGNVALFKDGAQIALSRYLLTVNPAPATGISYTVPSGVFYLDTPSAGVHTYKLQASTAGTANCAVDINRWNLVAYSPY